MLRSTTTWLYGVKDMASKSHTSSIDLPTLLVQGQTSFTQTHEILLDACRDDTGPGLLQFVLIIPAIGYTHCPLVHVV